MKTQKCAGLHMLLLLYVRLMLAVDAYRPQRDINQERWEQELREAGSLDELLMLTEYPDWKLWRCRLKLKHFEYATPPENRRSTRYAAASFSPQMLKDIDDEWQKTQCMPRETCVDVAKELGTNTAVFFKPPCVSVFRCGGCCNKEGVTCRNTIPGLEAVEMQAQAEVNSLCSRFVQPTDAKRLRPSCKHNFKHVMSKYFT
uniref:Vascular endothelial growth factor D n=1 Tax=Cyprinus carpio TaxID=7962 RepID=A0A8C1YGS6_CYPCA